MQIEINYRGKILLIDKGKMQNYEALTCRKLTTSAIDQYLLNDTDKSLLNPYDIAPPEKIMERYTVEEMVATVNKYIDIEIELGKELL